MSFVIDHFRKQVVVSGTKASLLRAGMMVLWVKCLQYKHKDPSSIPHCPHKIIPDLVMSVVFPVLSKSLDISGLAA